MIALFMVFPTNRKMLLFEHHHLFVAFLMSLIQSLGTSWNCKFYFNFIWKTNITNGARFDLPEKIIFHKRLSGLTSAARTCTVYLKACVSTKF
jgi:hypothetical protein